MPKQKLTSKEKDNLIGILIVNIEEKDRIIKKLLSEFINVSTTYEIIDND